MLNTLTVLAAGAGMVLGMPTLDTSAISRLAERDQNTCPQVLPGKGSQPDVDYFDGSPHGCPFKNKLDDDGSCKSHLTSDNGGQNFCTAYCEVKNSWFYGREVPFTESGRCFAEDDCTLATTHSLTVTQTFEFNVGVSLGKRDEESALSKREGDPAPALKAGFNLGASYSYATSKTTSNAFTHKRPESSKGKCGYWTFVPQFWTSCGSMTIASLGTNWYGGTFFCNDDAKTTGNYCNSVPYLDADGNQAGDVVFVLTDCDTFMLLPMDQQDSIYQRHGVSSTNNFATSMKAYAAPQ